MGILVDDINAASQRLKKLGVRFKETPEEGDYRTVAFITDPDGYWIELIQDPAISGVSPV
ncbi:hypothetical protein BY458DRAFT_555001 [Sporodiniella umbellata]|nr:hypothetical protein BY458DRAFT_555001 [Sporodiniella umbellata]